VSTRDPFLRGASPTSATFALLAIGGCNSVAHDASTGAEASSAQTVDDAPPHTDSDSATGNVTTPDPTVVTTNDTTTGQFDGSTTSSGDADDKIECDLWTQDCPPGEKCMPWAASGNWNATKCTPVARDPDGPGEACSVEGSPYGGVDSCELGAMCWNLDPRTDTGTCVAFCTGTPDAPLCEPAGTACAIRNQGVLILCLPTCDPVLQGCVDDQACIPLEAQFFCVPDASGELGAYGDPCEFLNFCDPGLYCAPNDAVPDCIGASGCCSEFCDIFADDPDAQCTGQPQGQVCVPWFEDGQAPQGLEHVGSCAVPA
jgi:hypothetical protein